MHLTLKRDSESILLSKIKAWGVPVNEGVPGDDPYFQFELVSASQVHGAHAASSGPWALARPRDT